MNVLVLTCDFHPTSSSVASCMKPLVISLGKNGHNVHVVTNNGIVNENNSFNVDGITIHRIVDEYTNRARQIDYTIRNKTANCYLQFILRKTCKLPYYIRYCLFRKKQRIGGWSINKSVKFCLALHQIHKFDVIISTSQPFTPHLMAMAFKKQCLDEIKWIAYEFDPYSYNATIKQTKSNISRYRKEELAVFALADTIILTPGVLYYYNPMDFCIYAWKVQPLSYVYSPIYFEKGLNQDPSMISTDCLFIYAGDLYTDIRNPHFALQVFSALSGDYKFLLLTNYREKEFVSITQSFPNIFELKEQVPQIEAISWLRKADFLVSIGNTVEMQVPAKIFEYMSLGKPIIHFSKISNDPAINYLNLYPAVLIIREYEMSNKNSVKKLEAFIQKYKDILISDDEIQKCLAKLDVQVVAKQFISIIEEK